MTERDNYGGKFEMVLLEEPTFSVVGPFVRNEDPPPSHTAAISVVTREGGIGQVRVGSHRHKVLIVFATCPQGITQEAAGRRAFNEHGVGAGTKAEHDVGRRRCVDLEEMLLIEPILDGSAFPDKKTTPWRLTALGEAVLAELNEELAA